MKEITIALVAQPNVGKSSLINALSNAHLKVGNFAGVTVDKMEVGLIHKEHQITIIDLPALTRSMTSPLKKRLLKIF